MLLSTRPNGVFRSCKPLIGFLATNMATMEFLFRYDMVRAQRAAFLSFLSKAVTVFFADWLPEVHAPPKAKQHSATKAMLRATHAQLRAMVENG